MSPDQCGANAIEVEGETRRERDLRGDLEIPPLESAADIHKMQSPDKRTKAERGTGMMRRNRAFEECTGEPVALRNRTGQESQSKERETAP